MAHSLSAKKRIRQNTKARLRNRGDKSALRSAVKKLRAATESGKAEDARALFVAVQKRADAIARKGVIKPATVARMKSRLARRINMLSAGAQPDAKK